MTESGTAEGEGEWFWQEMRTEVVECDVPIIVYPPSRQGASSEESNVSTAGGEEESCGVVEFSI